MSITNADLIADSLRELAVISEIQTPSAEQYAHALRKLNQMMAEWKESGINLQYFDQTSPSDVCPIPDYAQGGVIAMLATRLASNYGATVSIELAASAMSGYDTILRTAMNAALPVHRLNNRPCGEADGYSRSIIDG